MCYQMYHSDKVRKRNNNDSAIHNFVPWLAFVSCFLFCCSFHTTVILQGTLSKPCASSVYLLRIQVLPFSVKCHTVSKHTILNRTAKLMLHTDHSRLNHRKVKVQLPCAFNWVPRHKGVLREWRYSSTHSLISALDEGEWSASRPGHFTPRKTAPVTHWIGGWVCPRAGLDSVVKRKIPSPCRGSNPWSCFLYPSATSLSYPSSYLNQYEHYLNSLYQLHYCDYDLKDRRYM
jgi:hypothetical protein